MQAATAFEVVGRTSRCPEHPLYVPIYPEQERVEEPQVVA